MLSRIFSLQKTTYIDKIHTGVYVSSISTNVKRQVAFSIRRTVENLGKRNNKEMGKTILASVVFNEETTLPNYTQPPLL
jgi:hypothetical protein